MDTIEKLKEQIAELDDKIELQGINLKHEENK